MGTADAILIQTPSGHNLLVNGGESPSVLASALGRRLSPFDRHLDWLVVASPLEQQVAALPRTLDLYPPQNVLWSGNTDASYSAEETDRWLAANRIAVVQAYTGAELDLGKGAHLKILSASSRGAVLLVEWEGFRALLPVGVNFDVLDQLGNGKDIGRVTALLLADSGYGPSNPPEWDREPQSAVGHSFCGSWRFERIAGYCITGIPCKHHPPSHRSKRLDQSLFRWRGFLGGYRKEIN